jgi:hypothetical protein
MRMEFVVGSGLSDRRQVRLGRAPLWKREEDDYIEMLVFSIEKD